MNAAVCICLVFPSSLYVVAKSDIVNSTDMQLDSRQVSTAASKMYLGLKANPVARQSHVCHVRFGSNSPNQLSSISDSLHPFGGRDT